MMKYIDAHCHLQFPQYDQDREEIISQMRDAGIAAIAVGSDYDGYGSSKRAVALAEKHEHIFACVGVHPGNAKSEVFDEKEFLALAEHPKVVAIGECGLEYFHKEADDEEKNAQKELFKKHIVLAAEVNKPLMIHARPSKNSNDAYKDIIEVLKEAKIKYPNLRGDIHFFAGGLAEAEEFFKLGFTISFTAVITFTHDYDEVIKNVPLENILAETDAPFVAPASRRGQRNDPLAVVDVIAKIAEIRNEDSEMVRPTILENARRVFGL
jgi:TatD DNase family protein